MNNVGFSMLISPTIIGQTCSNIFRNLQSTKVPGSTKTVNIEVNSGAIDTPIGSYVQSLRLDQDDVSIRTTSTISSNEELYKISSDMRADTIHINTPFDDLISIGNELSIYSLINDNSLTIRCSAFALNESLFIFCGQSNAGKSTLIKQALNKFINIKIISDDHLIIKIDEKECICSTPCWDLNYNTAISYIPMRLSKIYFIVLDDLITDEIGIWEVLPHIVPFNFNNIINSYILDALDNLSSNINIKVLLGKKRNFEHNLKLVEQILSDS